MTKERRKLLQTAGRDREKVPASGKSGGFLSIHELEDGRLNLNDMNYCVKFAEPKEWAKCKKEVEVRRSKLPGYSYWKCLNPGCLWKTKLASDKQEPTTCLKCNKALYKDGSWMKRMSQAEAGQFERDTAEQVRRDLRYLERMAFNAENESRAKSGLEPLSHETFRRASEKAASWTRRR